MWKRLNKTDRRILAIAILLMLLMLYLLYDDRLILPNDDHSKSTPIGKISIMDRDVRRKVAKKFQWKSARKQDTVFVGDSLFTGPGSVAQVELKDGRKITLQENSLIVFNTTGDQLNLDLRFGRVAGKIDGCVQIQVKGQTKQVCGDKSEIEIDTDGVVEKASEKVISEIAWTQAPPKQFYHFKKSPLKLSWNAKGNFGRFQVQIAKDPEFESLVVDQRTQKNSYAVRNYPRTGHYFIRIQGDDLKGRPAAYSKVHEMDFEELPPPKITSPAQNFQLAVRTNVDGDLVSANSTTVQWSYPLKASQFDFELARDENFNEVVSRRSQISTSSQSTGPLAKGIYFARVRDAAVTDGDHRPWSETLKFSVDIADPPRMAAPTLLTDDVHYSAPSKEPLTLKWDPVKEADRYKVEVSPSPDFATKEEFKTEETEITIPNLTPGKKYFRVTAETEKGTRSDISPVGEMQVKLKRPDLNPVESPVVFGKTPEDPGDPQKLQVSWTDLKIAPAYVVEVSQDPKFETKTEIISKTPSAEIVLPKPGDYYSRVRAIDNDGKALTRYSDPQAMKYTLKVPLAMPVPIEPLDQITLFFQKNLPPYLWLEWTAVRQATHYNVEIARDREFQSKVLSFRTTGKRYLIKKPLPEGALYWRIQAQGDDNRVSHWSIPRIMNLYSGKAPMNRGPATRKKQVN